MKQRKYLTKSNFKIGLECPRKLYYLNKPDEYLNNNEEDPFLQALARGGYQVGALAKLKYPNGKEVFDRDHSVSHQTTKQLLESKSVVVFEGAFCHQSFFVRSDIVIRVENKIRIIEVKSKSFDPTDFESEFLSVRDSKPNAPKILSDWASYFYDIAFQTWVARQEYPECEVSASFMGVDKTSVSSESGLHQMFLVKQNGKEKEVVMTRKPDGNFRGHEILKEVDITYIIDSIIAGAERTQYLVAGDIQEKSRTIADYYLNNKKYPVQDLVGSQCKKCEFKGSHKNLKSGFDECWIEVSNIEAASSKTFVFDLWNFRGAEKAFEDQKYMLSDLDEEDLGSGKSAERQTIQLAKHKNKDLTPWFDLEGLRGEINKWKFPLHFIDFETCMPAIPFLKGFAPYSEVAFQFSHHTLNRNGLVAHVGQFIDLEPGNFPTFSFVRELKKQLESDQGTVFRYSSHENSVLNRAVFLLDRSSETDKGDLIEFIKSITAKKKDSKSKDFLWKGTRNMVDLLELTKQFYFSPRTGGSNSLKYVLPAILSESTFLQQKYSRPTYGTSDLISLNFNNHKWIEINDGGISDPYKCLPSIFSDEEISRIESMLSDEDVIRNGGAAMMAYCKAQFTEMSQEERGAIQKALLKYCELDTLAMVMLVEYWLDVTGAKN